MTAIDHAGACYGSRRLTRSTKGDRSSEVCCSDGEAEERAPDKADRAGATGQHGSQSREGTLAVSARRSTRLTVHGDRARRRAEPAVTRLRRAGGHAAAETVYAIQPACRSRRPRTSVRCAGRLRRPSDAGLVGRTVSSRSSAHGRGTVEPVRASIARASRAPPARTTRRAPSTAGPPARGGTPSPAGRSPRGRPSGRRGRRAGRRAGTAARSSRRPARARACRPRSAARSRRRARRTAGPRAGCRTGRAARPPAGAPSISASAGTTTGGPPSSTATRRTSPSSTSAVDDRAHRLRAAAGSGSARRSRPRSARRGPRRPAARSRGGTPPRSAPARRGSAAGSRARAGRRAAGSRRRPATTTSPAANRCSSIRFAGFQFHIPPAAAAPRRTASAARPRSRSAASTRLLDLRVVLVRAGPTSAARAGAPSAA